MNKSPFEGPFQITSRNLDHGAIVAAAGYHVQVTRQPAGRRALFTFTDTPETRALIDRYDNRKPLSIPTKTIIQERNRLYHEGRRLCMEAI